MVISSLEMESGEKIEKTIFRVWLALLLQKGSFMETTMIKTAEGIDQNCFDKLPQEQVLITTMGLSIYYVIKKVGGRGRPNYYVISKEGLVYQCCLITGWVGSKKVKILIT